MSLLEQMGREPFLRALDGVADDGHGIYSLDSLVDELGFPGPFVRALAQTHTGNPSRGKYTITNADGVPLEKPYGVYALDLLRAIVEDIGAIPEGEQKMGRGFEAERLTEAIRTTLAR